MRDQLNNLQAVKKLSNQSKPQVLVEQGSERFLLDSDEAVLTVLENGLIINCNKAGADLLGCDTNQLIWKPISSLLPQLADLELAQDKELNPYLHFLSLVGHRFEVIASNGGHFASELSFSEVEALGRRCVRIVMQPIRHGQATTLRHLRSY